MIPKDCKRLAEVDFPIAEVSRHAAREKSIRHGHPSTLHLWWARRPLASSRAILLGLLWPDPCDPLCPREFKEQAQKLLPQVAGCNPAATDQDLRKALLKFIADFANWDLASNRTYLDVSRALVKAAYGEEAPLVVDPFAGGGSIPLEALRVGCEAFASDLNPVSCLILRTMLDDVPRHKGNSAKEFSSVANEIRDAATRELTQVFPNDKDGSQPIAYLWARTARCEGPHCGMEIPLLGSLWLAKVQRTSAALRYRVDVGASKAERILRFDVFSPKSPSEVQKGTVARSKAKCPSCGYVVDSDRLAAQLHRQSGGADPIFDDDGTRIGGARLIAVVTRKAGVSGRTYRTATESDYSAIKAAKRLVAELSDELPGGSIERVPVPFGVINVRVYGIDTWEKLFSCRQKWALIVYARLIKRYASSPALRRLLVLPYGKLIDFNTSAARWAAGRETSAATFGRPAIPMVWDFCETVPISGSTGSWEGASEYVRKVVEDLQHVSPRPASVNRGDARDLGLPDDSFDVYFTDPPYYDNVPYSYISDTFYVWQRLMLKTTEGDAYTSAVTSKHSELVAYVGADGDKRAARLRFEQGLTAAFAEGARCVKQDGVGCVVFAHQTTEGWEALLAGLIGGGWAITSSWPIATERSVRPRARESAALATSVHLVCRPRPDDAPIGDWADVLRELPKRVGDWMERLQSEGVRGADLVFACIGPALEIFSRYTKVEAADGREVALAEYLEKVWEVVGRSALSQVLGTAEARARNGAAGALEEDARLTALFLWTLQSTNDEAAENASDEGDEEPADEEEDEEGTSRGKAKGFTLIFDVVRRFAQPLGIDLPKWEGRVIETKKGVVRLLPIAERTKQLFGDEGAQAVAIQLERGTAVGANPLQGLLFPEMEPAPKVRSRGARGRRGRVAADISDERLAAAREATTLDRVHAAMLLQAGGRTNALRTLLKAEQERSPDFLRLANALSALYPRGSEEKRLLDAMLLAVPR